MEIKMKRILKIFIIYYLLFYAKNELRNLAFSSFKIYNNIH